jgi:hypothetical protein
VRITIDIDSDGTTVRGGDGATAGANSGSSGTDAADGSLPSVMDAVSAAAVARRTGAVDAGAAPAGPDVPSSGSDPLPAVQRQATSSWAAGAESAGAAPTERG